MGGMMKIPERISKRTAPFQSDKYFPNKQITWMAHLRAHGVYNELYGGQTASRISDRGGFSDCELNVLYPEWKNHIIGNKWEDGE